MNAVAVIWCLAYTRLVPADEAAGRRSEMASHLHEAKVAGVSSWRVAAETLLGVAADLSWTARVRRRRAMTRLLLSPLVDATTGAAVAGALVVVTFVISTFDLGSLGAGVGRGVSWAAVGIMCSGHAVRFVRRLRRSSH